VGVSSPIVAHDYVYIGNNQKQVFAINYDTGGLAWTKKTRKWASRRSWSWTTMSVSGNRLFVFNGSSELFILHAKRGTTIDTISSRGAISRAPVVFKRHLFFTDSRNSIYAYDHFTNTKLWYKWMRGGDIRHGVAIDGDLVVHGHVDDYVYARALTTGKIFWYTKLGSDVAANPVIAYRYKMVIAGDARGGMHGLSIVDGKSKWSHTTPGGIYWSPAFGRGVAIFSSSKGRLIAIRVKTGKVLWKTGAGVARTPVSIAGSYVYYGTRSNKLVARSLWSGKTIWSYALSGLARSAPVIDHGTVFIHTNDGVLHALTQP
jgi:outer membrane protein assembly factor BamB